MQRVNALALIVDAVQQATLGILDVALDPGVRLLRPRLRIGDLLRQVADLPLDICLEGIDPLAQVTDWPLQVSPESADLPLQVGPESADLALQIDPERTELPVHVAPHEAEDRNQ